MHLILFIVFTLLHKSLVHLRTYELFYLCYFNLQFSYLYFLFSKHLHIIYYLCMSHLYSHLSLFYSIFVVIFSLFYLYYFPTAFYLQFFLLIIYSMCPICDIWLLFLVSPLKTHMPLLHYPFLLSFSFCPFFLFWIDLHQFFFYIDFL